MDKNVWKIDGKKVEYKVNLIFPDQLINILGEQNVEGVQIRIGMMMMVMMMKMLR